MIVYSRIARLRWGCALIALLQAVPAHADDVEPGNTDILVTAQPAQALTLPASTGSGLGLRPIDTPASIATLDGDAIRARGDLTVLDAVTRAPGITNAGNPGNGGTALAARGFSGQGSVLQLYDGVRLFPVAGTITFPVDPWNIERIEVLSGPASVLYGQGALGGAVNVITKQPDADRTRVEGQASYGSQQSWHVAAGTGGPIGHGFSYRLDASYRASEGYVDRGKSSSFALSGALRWQPGSAFSLTLRNDYGNQRPTEYFGTPLINGVLVDANQRRNYNVADAQLHYRDNRTTLTLDWRVADGVTINNAAYRLTSKRLFKNLESYFYNGATAQIDRFDNLGIVHDQTQIGNQGSIKISKPIGGIGNDLVIGFDVNHIKLIYSNDFGSDPQEDSVDPFAFDPGLFFDTQGIAPRYRTRTRAYSLFAENRISFREQFSIVAGIRDEYDRVERRNIVAGVSGPALFRKKLHDTSWRVGAVYQPVPTLSLYGQYSTGVDPLGTLTTFSAAQTAFKNAKGDQVEAGIKYSFLDGRGAATFAAYRIVKKNLLIRNPDDLRDTTPLPIGQRSAKGLEASLTVELAQGIGIDANGTILEARFDEFNVGTTSFNGNTPPGIAETAANLWLRWDAFDRFQARAGLRYVGRTFSDNANQFRIPAYAVVDGGVSYALGANVALDLRIYNLFDKDYATTSYNDEQWLLGRPRSFDIAIRGRF